MTPISAARQLEGRTLDTGWKVLRIVEPHPAATGGNFSCGYEVENSNGGRAFLKALDYSWAMQSADPAQALNVMTSAYIFERDLLNRCRDSGLTRIVLKLARTYGGEREDIPIITRAEEVLISLGALLHDIPHGPFSHDIEKKTHHIYPDGPQHPKKKVKSHYGPYDKHDDFISNPALYVFLMDTERSLLARVLRRYSKSFSYLLMGETAAHLTVFTAKLREHWPHFESELLPNLLFHLLAYEKPDDAAIHTLTLRTSFITKAESEWGLGPPESRLNLHNAWYQPFRHDIIGDTLSADLLDYMMRDQVHLGIESKLDLKLLDYYVLVAVHTKAVAPGAGGLPVS